MKLSGMKLNPIIYLVLSVFGTMVVTLMLEKPAEASLEICNKTGQQIHAGRVRYERNGEWVLVGAGQVLNDEKCMKVIRGSLTNRSYDITIGFPDPSRRNLSRPIILRYIDVGNDSDFTYEIGEESAPEILPRNCPPKADCLFYSTDPERSWRRGLILAGSGDVRRGLNELWWAANAYHRAKDWKRFDEIQEDIRRFERKLRD